MIPIAAKGANGDGPESRRNVLFSLGSWEIVHYKNLSKAYAVHDCNANDGGMTLVPPSTRSTRSCTKASELNLDKEVLCWNCFDRIPDEIITITRLYNG